MQVQPHLIAGGDGFPQQLRQGLERRPLWQALPLHSFEPERVDEPRDYLPVPPRHLEQAPHRPDHEALHGTRAVAAHLDVHGQDELTHARLYAVMTASRIFRIAGIYGIIALLPNFVMEGRFGLDHPPAITHPVFFYGFTGVALAWQVAFLLIAREPERLRPLMLPAILEKLAFFGAVGVLWAQGRCADVLLPFAAIDGAFALAFAVAWRTTPDAPPLGVR